MEELDKALSNKRVVVTGAGRGLGRSIAIVAADLGADVVLFGRNQSALAIVAATIKDRTGRKPLAVSCDLANPSSISRACELTLADNSSLDVLVNNGAQWLAGKIDELSETDIISTIAATVSGTILITKGLLPGLNNSSAADIITIVSTSGLLGWDLKGGSVPFYSAKHGQSGFSDKLRHELKGTNIRVSAIYPPDFDDADSTEGVSTIGQSTNPRISSREVVSTVVFVLTAPRSCCYPVIVMDGV